MVIVCTNNKFKIYSRPPFINRVLIFLLFYVSNKYGQNYFNIRIFVPANRKDQNLNSRNVDIFSNYFAKSKLL